MLYGRSGIRGASLLAAVLAGVLVGTAALAQGPGGPGGGRGGQGMRRGGFGRMGMNPTAASLPPEVLQRALKLTPAQADKINKIKEQGRSARRAMFQSGGPGGPGGPGGGMPDPATMQKAMAKMQALSAAESKQITALLGPPQKKTLAALLLDAKDYGMVGFPADSRSALKLTAAQHQKIVALAAEVRKSLPKPGAAPAAMRPAPTGGKLGAARRTPSGARPGTPQAAGMANMQALFAAFQKAHDKAVAVLTARQKAELQKITPQRRGFGGPGGGGMMGGPGGGMRGMGAPGGGARPGAAPRGR